MGISIDTVSGRGIIIYEEDEITALIEHINPDFDFQDEDDLEICLYESGLIEEHLTYLYVGNCVTGKDQGTFIKILSERGEKILESFGEPIEEINTVCIM